MFLKGVKPRTHLMIDLLLFTLLVMVALSTVIEPFVAPDDTHARFMFHAMHEVAGGAMFLAISAHLLFHLAWIRSQLSRLSKSQG